MRLSLIITLSIVVYSAKAQVVRITGKGRCIFDTMVSRITVLPTSFTKSDETPPLDIQISRPGYFRIGNENVYLASLDTVTLALDSCGISTRPLSKSAATMLFNEVDIQSAALFNVMNNCIDQAQYSNNYETIIQREFIKLDSLIKNYKQVPARDRRAIASYFAIKKMTIVSPGIHNSDLGMRQYAMQLVIENTPPIEMASVGSGKFALMVIGTAMAKDWPLFEQWFKRLSGIDRLLVSILLVNAAEFSRSVALPVDALSFLKNEIVGFREELNDTEADILIAMRQKLSLSGKGIKSMLGETILTDLKGKTIPADELQVVGSDTAVIYYWATWCGPCIEYIKAYLAHTAGKPKHIFISLDADEAKWKRFSLEMGIPADMNLQMGQEFIESFRRKFNIESLPAKFILTNEGFQFRNAAN